MKKLLLLLLFPLTVSAGDSLIVGGSSYKTNTGEQRAHKTLGWEHTEKTYFYQIGSANEGVPGGQRDILFANLGKRVDFIGPIQIGGVVSVVASDFERDHFDYEYKVIPMPIISISQYIDVMFIPRIDENDSTVYTQLKLPIN